MQQGQKPIKTIRTFLMLAVVCSLFFNVTYAAQGFIAYERYWKFKVEHILLRQIDKPRWTIGYRFAEGCSDEFRQREDKFKEMITDILRGWLQPIRELHPERAITDDFHFVRQKDYKGLDKADRQTVRGLEVRVTFMCEFGEIPSFALVLDDGAPEVYIYRRENDADHAIAFDLSHELGHALGMADTYIVDKDKKRSTGGMDWTLGKQPGSLMAGFSLTEPPVYLSEDDIKGIIWLYKYLYEGLPANDCFFPDYVYEEETRGCRPKYPLIFEVKHGVPFTVNWFLRDDPTFDVNARDASKMTALHYAVLRDSREIVERLLQHANIQVNIMDKHGRTPAKLARELQHVDLAALIEAHPSAKLPPHPVERAWTLATTWGAVKRR